VLPLPKFTIILLVSFRECTSASDL